MFEKFSEQLPEQLPEKEGVYLFTPSKERKGYYKVSTKIFIFWSNQERKDLLAYWDEGDMISARAELKKQGECSCPPFLDDFSQEGSWERISELPADLWEK